MRRLTATLMLLTALAEPLAAQALTVPINHSVRLNISGAASSVVVGNPLIADVTVVDSHTVFVSGRGYGATDVVVVDADGRTLFSGDITVAAGGGAVSLFRGAEKTSVACNPYCQEATGPASTAAANAATSPATPNASLAALGGLVAGAALNSHP